MGAPLIEFSATEKLRYFAPTALCAYLALLCVALVVTSAFVVTLSDAVAVAAVGVLGGLLSGALAVGLFRMQQRDRRYVTVATERDARQNFEAVRSALLGAGWRITCEEPASRLEARTIGAMQLAGERVAVRFCGSDVLVASVCDPAVGFSLAGRRRCERHRERLRRALAGAPPR
jgi:hypothetical protein